MTMHNRMDETHKPTPTFDSIFIEINPVTGAGIIGYATPGHLLSVEFDKSIPYIRHNAILANLVEEFF